MNVTRLILSTAGLLDLGSLLYVGYISPNIYAEPIPQQRLTDAVEIDELPEGLRNQIPDVIYMVDHRYERSATATSSDQLDISETLRKVTPETESFPAYGGVYIRVDEQGE